MKNKLIILGLSCDQGSSACLMIEGKIVEAVQEERFKRIKNFRGIPTQSIDYLLKKYNLKINELTEIICGTTNSIYPSSSKIIKLLIRYFILLIKDPTQFFYTKQYLRRITSEINYNKILINKINDFFDHLLKNNKFEEEMENLIILKKLLTQFDNLQESELLNISKPIISSDSVWKPHVLLLFGDYFMSKKEYVKAREFYEKILSTKGANQEFYDQAKLKLRKI